METGSLAEARARLREGRLDAALIDVGLPDGDGLDLVREIDDGGAGIRIPMLVLTANLDLSVAARIWCAATRLVHPRCAKRRTATVPASPKYT